MRNTSVFVLGSLFALASASGSGHAECIRSSSQQLAASASCGDEGSLRYCFSHRVSQNPATSMEQLTAELEDCFGNAGCTAPESQIEAAWTLRRCSPDASSDLRRRRGVDDAPVVVARQLDDDTTTARNQPQTTPRQANPTTTQNSPAQTTQSNVRQPTTTANRQQTTNQPTNPPTQNNTPTVAPVNPVSTEAPTTTTATADPNNPSECFTESMVDITSCPVQSTGPSSGRKMPCFPTSVPTKVCAAGKICQLDNQGNPSCMLKQSSLNAAGVVIAIFFATAIAASIIAVCFFCCRERKEQRRLIRAAEAAKIAQEAKTAALVSAKKPSTRSVSGGDMMDRQPLMSNAPAYPPQQYATGYSGAPGTEYGGAHGSNPFADSHDPHPLR